MAAKNIRKSLLKSYLVITAVMIIPISYSVLVARIQDRWYNRIISNVSAASSLGKIAKEELVDEIWSIVSGQKSFNEGEQYIYLRKIRSSLAAMSRTAGKQSEKLLQVADRTETTLRFYVDTLESQLIRGASVAENEAVMEDIRSVSSLLHDIMQDFIVSEIEAVSLSNARIKQSFLLLTLIQLAICLVILATAMRTSHNVSSRIASSISDMSRLSSRIASGDLQARANPPRVEELAPLATNLNLMAGRLQSLIDENIREQQNLQKAEMKALQAQITPHFLYNTLDTIIWLAEAEEIEEVVEVTKAFSQFFRISLSRGHEWITVSEELEHVKSYLTIQKIRYANILDYRIDAPAGIEKLPMLKLLLQPLVENAIYHGIKNKRGRGLIQVLVEKLEAADGAFAAPHPTEKALPTATAVAATPEKAPALLRFTVTDDGAGFTPERLTEVRAELSGEKDAEALAAYGLYNVNRRLKLYYGGEARLQLESTAGQGSRVTFTIPAGAVN